MTIEYEIKTGHTKQVLKDFIRLREAVRNSHYSLRCFAYGLLFLCSASATLRIKMIWPVLAFVGTILIIFALFQRQLQFIKLYNSDLLAKNHVPITFSFGSREFIITTGKEEEKIQYGEITSFYEDFRNFYVGVKDVDLHVLPKSDFTTGDYQGFNQFLAGKMNNVIGAKYFSMTMKEKIDDFKYRWSNR